MALTAEKVNEYIDDIRERLIAKNTEETLALDKTLDISFEEHFKFQQIQSEMHAGGILTPEATQIIYIALGENHAANRSNGGWSKETDTPTKLTVTKLMEELLSIKIRMHKRAQKMVKGHIK